MAIDNTRKLAGLASRPLVLNSANSQQSGQRLAQARPIYIRPDTGRSNASHHYENIPSSYGNNRQQPIYENLRGSGYTPELPPPLPPRAWIDPSRANQNQANSFQLAGSRGFPAQAANNLHQIHAPAPSNVSGFQTIAQAAQRFNEPSPAQSYSSAYQGVSHNTYPVQPYNSQQGSTYSSQQSQFYDPQQGRNYGSQENRNYDRPQAQHYEPHQVQPYRSQQSQYYDPQQGRNYGSQHSRSYVSQQSQNYTSRPFNDPSELASYQAEVERLLAHPNLRTISVPYGTQMGVFTTQAGSGIEFGRMQPGTTEFSQFPVGISSFGTSTYGSQNAQQVLPNQAQSDLPVVFRL